MVHSHIGREGRAHSSARGSNSVEQRTPSRRARGMRRRRWSAGAAVAAVVVGTFSARGARFSGALLRGADRPCIAVPELLRRRERPSALALPGRPPELSGWARADPGRARRRRRRRGVLLPRERGPRGVHDRDGPRGGVRRCRRRPGDHVPAPPGGGQGCDPGREVHDHRPVRQLRLHRRRLWPCQGVRHVPQRNQCRSGELQRGARRAQRGHRSVPDLGHLR